MENKMKEAITSYEINELIKKRWSPRSFDNREIDDNILMKLFEAARWAPSSMNEQPWGFIAVKKENESVFNKLAEALNEGNRTWAKHASVLAVVTARRTFSKQGWENKTASYDTGQAVAYLSLQAIQEGVYVHQLGGFTQEKVRDIFGISEDKDIIVVMAMGYLGDPGNLDDNLKQRELAARNRKHFDEFVQIIK